MKLYLSKNKIGIIISFHGGCFVGGNVNYDYDQNMFLSDLGYEVRQIEFPKKYDEFLKYIDDFTFNNDDLNYPIYVLGRSSGGFIAKLFFEKHKSYIHKALYLCPIMDPFKRIELLPKFETKTKEFFENVSDVKIDTFDSKREHILLATNDENLPIEVLTKEQLESSTYLGPKTHSSMLKTTSNIFGLFIKKYFIY